MQPSRDSRLELLCTHWCKPEGARAGSSAPCAEQHKAKALICHSAQWHCAAPLHSGCGSSAIPDTARRVLLELDITVPKAALPASRLRLAWVLSGTTKSPLIPAEKHKFYRPVCPEAPHTVAQGEMSFGGWLEKALITSLAT